MPERILDVPVPVSTKGAGKLWKRFNLHLIRETARSIRVQSGTLEVAMISTGKVAEAQAACKNLISLVQQMQTLLEGNQ